MKKSPILSLALALCMGAAYADDPGEWTTVTVSEPGEFYFKCLEASGGDVSTITHLKVAGTAESIDLSIKSYTNLVALDLSELDVTDKMLPKDFAYYHPSIQSVILPPCIETFSQGAFYGSSQLRSVTYTEAPVSVSFDYAAFAYTNLSELNVVNVDKIGQNAFTNCPFDASSFRGATELGTYAFYSSTL